MRAVIKLILLNLLIAQITALISVMIPCVIYLVATTGNLDKDTLITMLMIPAQLAGQSMIGTYLWKAGHINTKKITRSPVSSSYLLFSVLAVLTYGLIVSTLTELMKWTPNIVEQSLNILQSGWGGILVVVVTGPVLEELLFRGAIIEALLQQHNPTKAVLLSVFLFGAFHINPAQVLPALLIGILFAWTYHKIASLIPCILMYMPNSSLSVFPSTKYPEAGNMSDPMDTSSYLIATFVAVLILAGVTWAMCRTTVRYLQKEETSITD